MAVFTLTSGSDTFTGSGNDVDHFVGFAVPGFDPGVTDGSDTLDGGGGNDHFYFGSLGSGTITGGAGIDVVHAYGNIGFFTTFSGMEVLTLESTDSTALTGIAASHVNEFTTLNGHVFAGNQIALELGVDANLNFGSKVGAGATFGVDVRIAGIIDSGPGNSIIVTGTKNNDRFINDTGNNGSGIYDGGAGNDIFIADNSGGFDTLRGGAGNDLFDLDGTNFGLGGVKVSAIDGGAGVDEIEATNTSLVDIGLAGVEVLTGTSITLTGEQIALFDTFKNDSTSFLNLSGAGGNHNFTGRTPNGISLDVSQATSGGNYVFAASDDRWVGSEQHDETVQGGAGDDTFVVTWTDPATTSDEINGGDGDDKFVVTSGPDADSGSSPGLNAAPGNGPRLDGGRGNNTLSLDNDGNIIGIDCDNLSLCELLGYALSAYVVQSRAFVSYFVPEPPPPGPASLAADIQHVTVVLVGPGGELDFTTKAETLTPGLGVKIDGTALTSAFNITGSTRSDKITTTGFNDVLTGGLGTDQLIGGLGNDTYNLGAEKSGVDQVLDGGGTGDKITSTITRSLAHVEFSEIEQLTLLGGTAAINGTGNGFANIITGNNGKNILNGGADTVIDTLRGQLGNDTYTLGSGKDHVQDSGGIDTLTTTIGRNLASAEYTEIENLKLLGGTAAINGIGNAKANTITGNNGANTLNGAAGNDILIGGLGIDILTGGAGNDRFAFSAKAHSLVGAKADVITDFDDNGNDRIDLSDLLGPTLTWRDSQAFNGVGQVRAVTSGDDVLVSVNSGGSLAADMSIRLTGTTIDSMSAADFIL
ncbi:hypothetical protein BH10PSE7_BH10PSE7_08110 [soil metagenome]